MPWFKRLFASVLLRRSTFISDQCDLWYTQEHWYRFLSEHFNFAMSVSCYQCSIFLFILLAFSEGQRAQPESLKRKQSCLVYLGA